MPSSSKVFWKPVLTPTTILLINAPIINEFKVSIECRVMDIKEVGSHTQIRAIKRAVRKYNIDIPVFGMVKDDKHSTKDLIDESRNVIKLTEEEMNFITNLQDEVHKTAIE